MSVICAGIASVVILATEKMRRVCCWQESEQELPHLALVAGADARVSLLCYLLQLVLCTQRHLGFSHLF